jgi:hypothetical protein
MRARLLSLKAGVLSALLIGCIGAVPGSARAATSICDAVAGNLVTNCGFEGGFGSSTIGGNTNNSVPNGWTPSAGYDLEPGFNHSSTPNSGTFGLSIGNDDGQPIPTLSQTLTDVSGQMYSGEMYVLYGGAGTTDPNPFFDLFIDGISVVSLDNTAPGTYTEYSFSFTGSGSDVLTFGGNTSPSEWLVDDISVTASPVSATPLPAALPLFAGGLGMVGFLARRKKRKSAIA